MANTMRSHPTSHIFILEPYDSTFSYSFKLWILKQTICLHMQQTRNPEPSMRLEKAFIAMPASVAPNICEGVCGLAMGLLIDLYCDIERVFGHPGPLRS